MTHFDRKRRRIFLIIFTLNIVGLFCLAYFFNIDITAKLKYGGVILSAGLILVLSIVKKNINAGELVCYQTSNLSSCTDLLFMCLEHTNTT